MSSIEERLRQYIAENILFSSNGYPYPDDASFLENSIIDSMNIIELVMFLEQNFTIEVKDQEIVPDHFDSVTRLADFVRRKQALAV